MVGRLLPAEGRGEQAFCLSRIFSSSSSEAAISTASGVGEEMGHGAAAGSSGSSLRQQHEEDRLEEVPKAANSSHEPVGAKAGVSIHNTLRDVCLRKREQRSSEMPRTVSATIRHSHTNTLFCTTLPRCEQPQPLALTTSVHSRLLDQARELCERHFPHPTSTRQSVCFSAMPGERNATGILSSIFHSQ